MPHHLARLLGLALALAPLPAATAEEPPLPPPRPAELAPPPEPAPPLPPERPLELTPAAPAVAPAAPGVPAASAVLPDAPAPVSAAPLPDPVPEPPPRPSELTEAAVAEDAACRERLGGLGVAFEPIEPIADGVCGAARPLRITALPGGLALAPGVTARCAIGEALAHWSTDVRAAAQSHLKARPTKFLTGSYECRNRNHVFDAPLSEHALANAVDVMSFAFEGHRDLPVLGAAEGSPEAAFLAEVRAKACAAFTTVLGPGSDEAHATHLHLDLRARRNGYRICQ